MKKILFGGSPCQYWSISQKKNRETEPSGMGWELFKNYLIAKEKFQPDFFLYENNESASQAIKDQISKELGWPLQHINSALVSAQTRKRIYCHNWIGTQPEDRGILLKDILELSGSLVERDKAFCLCTNHMGTTRDYFKKHQSQIVFEPVCVAQRGRLNEDGEWEQHYEPRLDGKTNTITKVSKDNLIAQPVICTCYDQSITLDKNNPLFKPLPKELEGLVCDKGKIYEVIDGYIETKVGRYKCNMPNGFYIIRKLTIHESARLQTMPDEYFDIDTVSNNQKMKGIGNGWTAEVIIHQLKEGLNDVLRNEKLVVLSLYDGIGTAMYCLKQLGFTDITYKAYEIDKYAIQIAQYNHPEIIQCGDAFQVRNDNWMY